LYTIRSMKLADKETAKETLSGILRLVKLGKMRSIYEGITPADDGAVHSFQNPAGTETTRFSHSGTWLFEPGSYNLATLPKKTALLNPLFKVRNCIIPHRGRILGASDYRQAEARWCAYIAGDPVRIKLFEDGIDPYRWFVAILKWEDESRLDEVTEAERNSIGKVGKLSGQYKVGWRTLKDAVNGDFELHGVSINAKTAKAMEAIWPTMMPRTVEYWAEVKHQVLGEGYTINPFGRKRIYFGRKDSEAGREAVVREAIADDSQSANAMAVNSAIQKLYRLYDPKLLRVLMNVHDEILFDFAHCDLKKVVRVVREVMEEPFEVGGRSFVIPAEVNVTSKNWGDMTQVRG